MPRIPVPSPIEFIVKRRHPLGYKLLTREATLVTEHSGHPIEQDAPDATRDAEAAQALFEELQRKPVDEIEALYQAERKLELAERATEADKQEHREFFHQQWAMADFAYWAKSPYWKLDEAVSLALGRDPKTVTHERMKPHFGRAKFAREYDRLHELVWRGYGASELGDRVEPTRFLKWADARRIDVHEALRAAVAELFPVPDHIPVTTPGQPLPAQAEAAAEQLGETARRSLLKLLLGISIKKYRFDPKASRQSTATNIQNDLAELGIKIDLDTVRKWLKAAGDEIEIETDLDEPKPKSV